MPRTPEVCPCCLLNGHKHVLTSGYNIAIIGIAQGSLRPTTTNDEGVFMVMLLPTSNNPIKPEHEWVNRDKSRNAVRNVKRGTAFRRLANGAFALAGLAATALLPVSVSGKLSLVPAFIIVTVALFLGLVGLFCHLQADIFEIEDTK